MQVRVRLQEPALFEFRQVTPPTLQLFVALGGHATVRLA